MSESLSPENVSSLIEHILKDKDPATVGLRRILKRKEDEGKDFPVKNPRLEEFSMPGTGKRSLNEDEQRILELEKQVIELKKELESGKESARKAVQGSYNKGLQEGIQKGIEQATKDTSAKYERKIDDLQKRIELYLRTFEDSKRNIFLNAEHVVLRFCCEMVKKIINTELTTNKEVLLSIIKKGLSFIGEKDKVIIRVSPNDIETVSGRKEFWVPVTERLTEIKIEPDNRIEPGGCIIESNSGLVDARLGVQFEEMQGLVENVWVSACSNTDK